MSFSRAVFNGIGTGAGVAWPLFGIVFSLVGGPIGSCLSLALGILSSLLFISISLSIFYLSYKETKDKEGKFSEQYLKHQRKLIHSMKVYIRSIHSKKQNTEELMAHDLEKASNQTSPLHKILSIIWDVKQAEGQLCLDPASLMKHVSKKEGKALKIPMHQKMISAFSGFVSTFGSIAGCSAGLAGLLTGLGVFAGFATFPILGWSILAVSLIFGLWIAVEAARYTEEDFQSKALDQSIKKMRHQLDRTSIEHRVDTSLHSSLAGLTSDLEQEEIAYAQIKQPLVKALNVKSTVHDDRPSLLIPDGSLHYEEMCRHNDPARPG